ncbi:MAG: tetratricopeptide repeat protein [Verrucomicrobiae bacterium]|nr:tetratricopeptide repeat protein [Verrucomicrobiae bacterium]
MITIRIAMALLSGFIVCACDKQSTQSASSTSAPPPAPTAVENPTFSLDVAPIIYSKCAGCHRPGESAPFALLDYEDVRKRGEQIQEVVESGYMPPWLPEPQPHEFADLRRLTDQQKDVLRKWVAQGMVEGNVDDLPELPTWTEGWQLGEPDLIVELPAGYTLPAEGADIFRSFVLPLDIDDTHYVCSVEIRPENPRIIHHGVILKDPGQIGRQRDATDPQPGYAGMQQPSLISSPDGQFVGWTPGKVPKEGPEDMAWKLEPGTDLIAALHLLPSGKPEPLKLRVGLHFADRPPTRTPAMIQLEIQTIDIAAGDPEYTISETFTLPVDVNLLGIYPHAHYLGREMRVTATTPADQQIDLLHIKNWDFNWQDDYRYAEPFTLPEGSTIHMHFTYDNSTRNERNPNNPPQRVTYGELSSNEMGSLWIQVLPRRAADLPKLEKAIAEKSAAEALAGFRFALQLNPDDPEAHSNLGAALSIEKKFRQARSHFEQALAVNPDHVAAHFNFGLLLVETGDPAAARLHFQKAVATDPTHAAAWHQLGQLALDRRDPTEAITCFKRSLEARNDVETHYNIGVTYLAMDRAQDAAPFLETAAHLKPEDALTQLNLGAAYFNMEDWESAETRFRNTILLAPGFVPGYLNLGNSLIKQQRIEEALDCFKRATQLEPGNQQAWESVAAAQQLLDSR